MAKVFLFDEARELIRYFDSPADCAAAMGVGTGAVEAGVKRQQVIRSRYYVADTPRLPPLAPRRTHERNAALNMNNSEGHPGSGTDIGFRRTSTEELAGLTLLAGGLSFDAYLYGQLPDRKEQPESFPSWNPLKL